MWKIQTDFSQVNFTEDLDISQNIVHQLQEENLCCLRNIPNNRILPWLQSKNTISNLQTTFVYQPNEKSLQRWI
jgi:hypothetical protein